MDLKDPVTLSESNRKSESFLWSLPVLNVKSKFNFLRHMYRRRFWVRFLSGWMDHRVSFPAEVEFEFTTSSWVQATAKMAIGGGSHCWWLFQRWLFFLPLICIHKQIKKKLGQPLPEWPFRRWLELKLRWWTQTLPRLYRIHGPPLFHLRQTLTFD